MRIQRLVYLALIPAIVVYVWAAVGFDFCQDDAYISFRYVANYLNGDGLVFNIGERVEGFTNFGWVVYLLFLGGLGLNYILGSKITGIALGVATIVVTTLIARLFFDNRLKWLSLIPVYLIAFNFSFAYWSQAGLETSAFVFMATLSLYLFLIRHYLLVAVLTLVVLIRPEGVLVAVILVMIEVIVHRQRPVFTLTCGAVALVLLLPYLLFKMIYYGSILPNPFYAKAGFDLDQVVNGLEYTARFFKHYAYYPAALLISLFYWRKLSDEMKATWLFTCLFTVYIVLIGGDVLKVHRFFLPILAPASVLVTLSIYLVLARLKDKVIYLLSFLLAIGLLGITYAVPRDFITYYEHMEKGLTHKFRHLARQMKQSDPSNFSVALSTIGIFSYELIGHRVIDMLGLTDSTIARHPEPAIEGIESTWRERRHNSRYVLELAPDYVIFSTGQKPSAPAERVLMLYRQFLDAYRVVSWHYRPNIPGVPEGDIPVFKRMRPLESPFLPTVPMTFVQYYRTGLDLLDAGDHVRSQQYLQKALQVGGDPPYPYLVYKTVFNHFRFGEVEIGRRLLNEIIARDSLVCEPHADLYIYEYATGNREKAMVHRRWIENLAPWQLPRFDSLAERMANRTDR